MAAVVDLIFDLTADCIELKVTPRDNEDLRVELIRKRLGGVVDHAKVILRSWKRSVDRGTARLLILCCNDTAEKN